MLTDVFLHITYFTTCRCVKICHSCMTNTLPITPPYEKNYIIRRGKLDRMKVEVQLSEASGNGMKRYTLREEIKCNWSFHR